jgi:hypothetical protein
MIEIVVRLYIGNKAGARAATLALIGTLAIKVRLRCLCILFILD